MNFRSCAVGAIAILAAGAAVAGPKEDVLNDLGQCAAMKDDAARLACYDALAPRAKAAIAPPVAAAPPMETSPPTNVATAPNPPAPPSEASAAPPPEEQESWFGRNIGSIFATPPEQQTTAEKFGADKLPPPPSEIAPNAQPQELDSITENVSDVAFTPFGKFIIVLKNGQIWRQIEGDSEQAYFRKNAADNMVTISRGLLGSYNLKINDSVKLFKVTRLK